MRRGLGWTAALGMAAAAAVGCAGPGAAAPVHPDSRHLPIGWRCLARPGWAAITLTNTSPRPRVMVLRGAHVVVTVPRWGQGTATEVDVARGGILREQCTVLLPGHGRRTIFRAARPGSTRLGATVQPASTLMMPAWEGTVIVHAGPG